MHLKNAACVRLIAVSEPDKKQTSTTIVFIIIIVKQEMNSENKCAVKWYKFRFANKNAFKQFGLDGFRQIASAFFLSSSNASENRIINEIRYLFQGKILLAYQIYIAIWLLCVLRFLNSYFNFVSQSSAQNYKN